MAPSYPRTLVRRVAGPLGPSFARGDELLEPGRPAKRREDVTAPTLTRGAEHPPKFGDVLACLIRGDEG